MQASLDPRTSALLILHWQNELAKPGGLVSTPLPGLLAAAGTVQRLQNAHQASRERGIQVVFVNASHRRCNSSSREAHDYCVKNTLPMLGAVCGAADYVEALCPTV